MARLILLCSTPPTAIYKTCGHCNAGESAKECALHQSVSKLYALVQVTVLMLQVLYK